MTEVLYKRIVLKLSGEALGGDAGQGFDWTFVEGLCSALEEVRKTGIQVAVVTGGGNILRGREIKGPRIGRNAADTMGMMATLINGIALREMFEALDIPVCLMTALQAPHVAPAYNPFDAVKALNGGNVLVISGGTGHPFFSTDTGAALRAAELGADALLKATNVPGVFDRDPTKFTTARMFSTLTYEEVIERELGVMDLTAITLCKENHIPIRVFDLRNPWFLLDVCSNNDLGTTIGAEGVIRRRR